MKRLVLALPFLAVVLYLMAGGAAATTATIVYQVDMAPSEEVPPAESEAHGLVRFSFNEDLTRATYAIHVRGLSNTLVLGADIHEGRPGTNGPVVHHLADGDFIVTAGVLSLTREDLTHMVNGDWYVSVKSTFYPEGTMRGQIRLPTSALSGIIDEEPSGDENPPEVEDPEGPEEEPQEPDKDSEASTQTPEPDAGGEAPSGTQRISPPDTGTAGLRR